MRTAIYSHSAMGAIGLDATDRQVYQRRRHIRYPIRVPVSVQWVSHRGGGGSLKGRTKNISEGGAFIYSRVLPPLGAAVELKMQLPVSQSGVVSSRLEMQGEVFRVETPSGRESQWGFAIYATKTVMHGPADPPVFDVKK